MKKQTYINQRYSRLRFYRTGRSNGNVCNALLRNNFYLRARSEKDDRDWSSIEKILWHILSYLSSYCPMDSQALQKYTLSATSREIFKGLLNLPKEAGENVFALFENEENSDWYKDILGIWAGAIESGKLRLGVLNELKSEIYNSCRSRRHR